MTKIVQLAGDDRETQDSYVGAVRELTVDTTNWDLRIHDGVTPGGRRILNFDNSQGRFQARAPELDGISFSPFLRGFLARIGPAEYRLRRLTVNTDNLTLDNPVGFLGNPLFSLKPIVASQHTWTGLQKFDGGAQAAGGFAGDLTGDVQGNLTGDSTGHHTGDVTGNLTGNSAGIHTGAQVGDVDVRGKVLQLDDGQVGLHALANDVRDYIKLHIPPGVIMLWSGLIENIPPGWYLCDGTHSTPDLRDRFVVGAGDSYLEGDVGGSSLITISGETDEDGIHGHTATGNPHTLTLAEMPGHEHYAGMSDNNVDNIFVYGNVAITTPGSYGGLRSQAPGAGGLQALTSNVGDGAPHSHSVTVDDSDPHTHTLTIPDVDARPPFYALAYIQKGPIP